MSIDDARRPLALLEPDGVEAHNRYTVTMSLNDLDLTAVVVWRLISFAIEEEILVALDVTDRVGCIFEEVLDCLRLKTNLSSTRECNPRNLMSLTWKGLSTL